MDIHSLLVSYLVMLLVYTAALLVIRAHQEQGYGLSWLAGAHSALGVGVSLLALRGIVPLKYSVIGSNLFVLCAFVGQHKAFITATRKHTRRILPVVSIALIALSIIVYFTLVSDNSRVRVTVQSVAYALINLLSARVLLDKCRKEIARIWLGCTLVLFSFFLIYRAFDVSLNGLPAEMSRWSQVHAWNIIALNALTASTVLAFIAMVNTRLRSQLEKLALFDELTGLLNRRACDLEIRKELQRSRRTEECFSLLLLDLDHFKSINDTRGHAAGDIALRAVAECLEAQLRSYDRAARFGGEEFLVLLPATSGEGAVKLADRIRGVIEQLRIEIPGQSFLTLTCSVGVTQWTPHDNYTELVERADRALYEAKASGRNCTISKLATDSVVSPA